MIVSRILGLMLAPIGVLVLGWAVAQMILNSPVGGGWIAPGIGLGIGGAAIIVGARYLLKPKPQSGPQTGPQSGKSADGGR